MKKHFTVKKSNATNSVFDKNAKIIFAVRGCNGIVLFSMNTNLMYEDGAVKPNPEKPEIQLIVAEKDSDASSDYTFFYEDVEYKRIDQKMVTAETILNSMISSGSYGMYNYMKMVYKHCLITTPFKKLMHYLFNLS